MTATPTLPGLEPTHADQLASLDRLIADAKAKRSAAARMQDSMVASHWTREADRLRALRRILISKTQTEMPFCLPTLRLCQQSGDVYPDDRS